VLSCRRCLIAVLIAVLTASATVVAPVASAATSKAPKLGDRTLRTGDRGADVRALQRALGRVGFDVKVDGNYGAGTVRAVKRFQRSARLSTSGTAGRKTLAALRNALTGGAANTSGGYGPDSASQKRSSLGDRIPLERGMSGHDVRVLQDFLRRSGQTVSIDGEYGAGTVRAVKAFETAQSRTVDGIMDAGDIDALRSAATGGGTTQPAQLAPGDRAQVGSDGLALAPANAPDAVKAIIAAGNVIAKKPYRYGGGHGSWNDSGYDCSGSVSYALHGAKLLDAPLASGDFMSWGDAGPGQWVTLYAKSSHIFMVVAGLRFDTSGRSNAGTRWQADMRSGAGYAVRHPTGL
jgi:peptidoglycan hydrolase-like protein with peptidoglycan-binding domain